MRDDYDMSGARRATQVEHLNRLRSGKTRITLCLDNEVLDAFRSRAEKLGKGYQTLINEALQEFLGHGPSTPLDETMLRRMLREELDRATVPG
jgi:uncharacterized protein (DUF4415 family)